MHLGRTESGSTPDCLVYSRSGVCIVHMPIMIEENEGNSVVRSGECREMELSAAAQFRRCAAGIRCLGWSG